MFFSFVYIFDILMFKPKPIQPRKLGAPFQERMCAGTAIGLPVHSRGSFEGLPIICTVYIIKCIYIYRVHIVCICIYIYTYAAHGTPKKNLALKASFR